MRQMAIMGVARALFTDIVAVDQWSRTGSSVLPTVPDMVHSSEFQTTVIREPTADEHVTMSQ